MFSKSDINQINQRGTNTETIEKQINCYKKGFPFMRLYASATLKNGGVIKLEKEEIENFCEIYDQNLSKIKVIKFVPASGAASRMFKSLFSFRENYDGSEKAYHDYLADSSFNSVFKFIQEIENFAFYNDLADALSKKNVDITNCILQKDFNTVIDHLLLNKGHNYAALPKGLLKFHKYNGNSRTAFEEHLVEGAAYSRDVDNVASLHFTVSPEHIDKFQTLLSQVLGHYKNAYKIQFDVTFSVQKSSTDTVAVDMNNNPFREDDGSILFRPGGHGALLDNLNDLNGDIIFIKNIDNVVPDRIKTETFLYKKALAGLLIKIQKKLHDYLHLLNAGDLDETMFSEIILFATDILKIPEDTIKGRNKSEIAAIFRSKFNRPIRVCGMVKNEGEPGGGPFWVKNNNGEISLQIVESSQIDLKDEMQKNIFDQSTHFNPVDLVCGVKNYKGEKFNLMNFSDPDTGFISIKSKDGKNLKAMELPGLWNGAMSDWITIFVEVPIITFNPVKTVNDLLRNEHQ